MALDLTDGTVLYYLIPGSKGQEWNACVPIHDLGTRKNTFIPACHPELLEAFAGSGEEYTIIRRTPFVELYHGKTVCANLAVGEVFLYRRKKIQVRKREIRDPNAEVTRFIAAKDTAVAQLNEVWQKAVKEVGPDEAAVFLFHKMLLEDKNYVSEVQKNILTRQMNAEYAVAVARDHFSEMFAQMEDPYMRARASDMKDISERLLAVLDAAAAREEDPAMHGFAADGRPLLLKPVILMAEDLAPSELIQLDKSNILAIATRYGCAESHASIFARSMGIPSVTGIDIREEWSGKIAIVDGDTGTVIIDPDPAFLAQIAGRSPAECQKRAFIP